MRCTASFLQVKKRQKQQGVYSSHGQNNPDSIHLTRQNTQLAVWTLIREIGNATSTTKKMYVAAVAVALRQDRDNMGIDEYHTTKKNTNSGALKKRKYFQHATQILWYCYT